MSFLAKTWPTIVPSLSSCPVATLEENLDHLIGRGAKLFHVDCIDGKFVPNKNDGVALIRSIHSKIASASCAIDVHLLVKEPLRYIDELSVFSIATVSVHAESSVSLEQAAFRLRAYGIIPGLAILPTTVLDEQWFRPDAFAYAHIVTADNGLFVEAMIERVRYLSSYTRFDFSITVDGGIGEQQIPPLVRSGARNIVVGSAIFASTDLGSQYAKFVSTSASAVPSEAKKCQS